MTSSARAAGAAAPRLPAHRLWSWPVRACAGLALLLAAAAVALAQDSASAAAVKAAYLVKFLNYVDLPAAAFAQPDSPIVIGVAGADDVYAELVQVLRERGAGARPVHARRLAEHEAPAGVQVLFIGAQIDPQRSALAHAARERPVLLVTDTSDGLKAGACINFAIVHNRVRFEVSLDAAERHSIRISSRVLALAERVVGVH